MKTKTIKIIIPKETYKEIEYLSEINDDYIEWFCSIVHDRYVIEKAYERFKKKLRALSECSYLNGV